MNPTKFMSLITHHSRRNKSQSPVHGLLGPWDSTSSCLLGPYLQIFPNSFLSHPCLLINSQNCQGPPAKGTLLYSVMSYCLDKLYGSAPPPIAVSLTCSFQVSMQDYLIVESSAIFYIPRAQPTVACPYSPYLTLFYFLPNIP